MNESHYHKLGFGSLAELQFVEEAKVVTSIQHFALGLAFEKFISPLRRPSYDRWLFPIETPGQGQCWLIPNAY